MSSFPGSPRLLKGAIVSGLKAIVFQYNPEKLTRTLTASTTPVGGVSGGSDLLRLKGPPAETIALDLFLDASDDLEQDKESATSLGIYPKLAALETLLYPLSYRMIANEALALVGVIEVVPPAPTLTLLVWGTNRVVPIRISSFQVTEEQFDPSLNPIRASVKLSVQVLTYQDLGMASVGGGLSMANHIQKESLSSKLSTKSALSAMKKGGG
jgi:hypothetical protein